MSFRQLFVWTLIVLSIEFRSGVAANGRTPPCQRVVASVCHSKAPTTRGFETFRLMKTTACKI